MFNWESSSPSTGIDLKTLMSPRDHHVIFGPLKYSFPQNEYLKKIMWNKLSPWNVGSPLPCEISASLSPERLHQEQSCAPTKWLTGALRVMVFPRMNSDDKAVGSILDWPDFGSSRWLCSTLPLSTRIVKKKKTPTTTEPWEKEPHLL